VTQPHFGKKFTQKGLNNGDADLPTQPNFGPQIAFKRLQWERSPVNYHCHRSSMKAVLNRQIGVKKFKYGVTGDPLFTGLKGVA